MLQNLEWWALMKIGCGSGPTATAGWCGGGGGTGTGVVGRCTTPRVKRPLRSSLGSSDLFLVLESLSTSVKPGTMDSKLLEELDFFFNFSFFTFSCNIFGFQFSDVYLNLAKIIIIIRECLIFPILKSLCSHETWSGQRWKECAP